MERRAGRGMRLQYLLTGVIAIVVLLALLPAGLAVDRRLTGELQARARGDLERAVRILEDRMASEGAAMMMHAKEVAGRADVARHVDAGRAGEGAALVAAAAAPYGEDPVLHMGGDPIAGPPLPDHLVEATRRGEMPVAVIEDGVGLRTVALAPVMAGGRWIGAAGVSRPWGTEEAAVLAALTRTDVVVEGSDGVAVASSLAEGGPPPWREGEGRWLRSTASAGPGRVVFARDLRRELELVSTLRRAGVAGLGGGLALALLVGGLLAGRVARPARALASAAQGVSRGEFGVGLEPSRVWELRQVGEAFEEMRAALVARMTELNAANRELRDRQERLIELQAELIRQDRLAAAGQLVAQLAHEIRNPVANVRNCLEVVRRRVTDDPAAQEFTDLAVEELRRMHGLAERLLDLHRPGDPAAGDARATSVAREVAALEEIGAGEGFRVQVEGDAGLVVVMPADGLKQVLASLVQNAREAMGGRGTVELRVRRSGGVAIVDVLDEGPGIPPEILPRVFDPFFTTKRSVQGVGLGLFVAEAMVRSHGGRLSCANRADRVGAAFRIELDMREAAVGAGGAAR